MAERPSVLIVDDDPMHLQIYGWIVSSAGYSPLLAEVGFLGVDIPNDPPDLVLLDYHLGPGKPIQIATLIRSRFPTVPIIVLSAQFGLPHDIAPLVDGFVHKGDPAKLVESLKQLLPCLS